MTGAPHLPRSALLFARVLRGLGLSVAADDVTAFLQSMQAIGVRSRDDVRAAARSLFTTSVTQHERFDRAFDRFWSHRRLPDREGLPPPEVEMKRDGARRGGHRHRRLGGVGDLRPDPDLVGHGAPAAQGLRRHGRSRATGRCTI